MLYNIWSYKCKNTGFPVLYLISVRFLKLRLFRTFAILTDFCCILVEGQVRWKRGFEIILIEHYAGDIWNKNTCINVYLYYAGHFTENVITIIPRFIWYVYYVSACNRDLFKSFDCYVLFLSSGKSFKYYEKCFLIPSLRVLEKNSFLNRLKAHML